MLIQCTKTLLDKLGLQKSGLKPPEGFEYFPESLAAWHANYIILDRRKAIVLMNNETRFPVVIYRPKIKDFKKIDVLIPEAIRTALCMEGVSKKVIDNYFAAAGELEFTRTASKSLVAQMNNSINEIAFMWEHLDENSLIQRYISLAAGRLLQKSKNGDYYYPAERMLEYLAIYSERQQVANPDDVRELSLYQLKIEIEIEGYEIWRRVLVPSTCSFRHLHKIIQTVFDWQNYHLHMFEAKKVGAKVKEIVMDDDPETLEWIDTVSFLEGEGERPPEDIGGSWGYQEYIRIMANSDDPEYESMKIWSESQKERNFNKEQINDRLERVISGYSYYG